MNLTDSILSKKIPTLLGLALLLTSTGVGIVLVGKTQVFKSQAAVSDSPREVTVVNISATSAAIYWLTDKEITGFVQAGPSPLLGLTFKDERDPAAPQKHQVHFVVLNNLSPNSTHYFQINSGSSLYPPSTTLNFKTTLSTAPTPLEPLIGSIVDLGGRPITEAVISLELPGAQKLATVSKVAGNFILPLSDLKSTNLSQAFTGEATNALIKIFNNEKSSEIKLTIPLASPLPKIVLGQNLDLTSPPASPSVQPTSISKYDLNHDGKINSLDLSILIKNWGKNPKLKEADLNGDGIVDQTDVNLLNQQISQSVSR